MGAYSAAQLLADRLNVAVAELARTQQALEILEQRGNYGMSVNLRRLQADGREVVEILRNVTEIHYRYAGQPSIAFESDFHGTGMTCALVDVLEFETTTETSKAEAF